jgi:hypothetical protein
MVVITAPNLGPRGSMSMVMLLAMSRLLVVGCRRAFSRPDA